MNEPTPKAPKRGRRAAYNTTLPPSLLERLRAVAKSEDTSMASIVEAGVRAEVWRRERAAKKAHKIADALASAATTNAAAEEH